MAQGDQIYVFRELVNVEGVYQHHGIDCGDGSVIHYRKPSETIERTSVATFARENKIYIKIYPVGFCFIPDIVVKRAESRLGERKYNLLFNNCEHFANWCKTGNNYSQQIKELIPAIANLDTRNLNDAESTSPQQLVKQALTEIESVWNEIQPQYKKALQETDVWEKVAWQALKKNREDLAKAALGRKLDYKQRADKLKEKLAHLATMTETLIRNSQTS